MGATRCALLCALLTNEASAQTTDDWGTVGRWATMVPASGSVNPPANSWHHAATAQGCFYIVGGEGATNSNRTFQYDLASNLWTELAALPAGFRAPSLAVIGGAMILFGGANDFGASDTFAVLSLDNTSMGWTSYVTPPPPQAPGPRSGHRMFSWGGLVYQLGGWDQNQYYNDVWAFDFDSYFRSNKTCNTGAACWLQITPNDAPGMFAKRNSFSLDVYGSGVILFGGFWHDIAAGGSFSGCSPTVKCIWYNDVWAWRPGPVGTAGLKPLSGNGGWTQLSAGGGPAGRSVHASGILGDQLFIYGGNSEQGWLGDMWTYNMPSAKWAQISNSGQSPGPLGAPAAVFIGRHMYLYGGSASTTLYQWTPLSAPPPSETISFSTAGLATGVSLSILLNIACLAFGIVVWKRTGGQLANFNPMSAGPTKSEIGVVYDQLG